MIRRTVAALAATALCAFAHPASAQLAANVSVGGEEARLSRLVSALDSIAREAMEDQSIPGLSVAIVKDGRVVLERGWGTAERGRRHATAHTVYQIASISKQFTAAAILRLAERGELSLDDDVARYVEGLPAGYRTISLRQLLNHTAGVPNFTEFFREFRQVLTPAQLIDSLAARPLQFAPGTGFHYSNSGYYLLGLVIERVTGQSYDGYLRQQFFAPLGMNHTEYCGDSPGRPLPTGYVRTRRGTPVHTTPWDPSVLYAAGSLCSTAADIAKWEVALGEGRVLAPESFREMTTPVAPPDVHVRMSYGFGMMVDTTDAGPYLHHDGAVAGFRAQAAWYPNERLAVVVLMNQGLAAPEPIERDFTRAVLGVTARPTPRLVDRPAPRTHVASGSFGRPLEIDP
ncbi:MAG TPA: serine hydrolase domain-containing protein [Longimicrobium sp.]|nr:serine hydrolase domain-containing protein [Longimicrobium sp.]